MTRLTQADIDTLCAGLPDYDRYLRSATGRSLLGVGAAAAGVADIRTLRRNAPSVRMAVVPITGGQGLISGFASTVGGILGHLGFAAWVTECGDVSGFAEAMERGAQVIYAADDGRFVAFCCRPSAIVDNAWATAAGYVAGLDLMAGGLAGRQVLVLGCGPVGRWAVQALLKRRARVCVADRVPGRAADLVRRAATEWGATLRLAAGGAADLADHDLIVDATDAADIIDLDHLTPRTRIAAPGMPCGVTPRAREQLAGRMLHDPLPIGVAVMACAAMRRLGRVDPGGLPGGRP